MAAEIFTALSNLRMILDTETDADSPITETLKDAMRYAVECLIILGFGTGTTGSATSDPPDDSTGVLTNSGASYATDEHNGRTLVMTSGSAKGNAYTIDDTTATTIICTGDNLYSDGVRSGDDYIVLYDLKSNADGHDHDGVNSKEVVLEKGRVMICMFPVDDDVRLSTNSTWENVWSAYLYIPASANTIYGKFRIKTDNGSVVAGVRMNCGGESSSAAETTNTSYEWQAELSVDVSGVAEGWTLFYVQLYSAGGAGTASVQGFSLAWGP